MSRFFSKFSAFLPFILILILSFFTWKSLLNRGYFSMHDDQQVVRLQQMDKSLKAGQFPVRWTQDLGFGYGYPVFDFYPPLAYYTGEIIHLFGPGYIDSIKIVWFLALVGSAFSMYFLGKELFGKIGGLTSSIFYLYAPYHAVDAFVRGALAELCSFVWLPLILLFSYKAIKEKKFKWAIWAGVFFGLLMITHNLIFLPFAGILGLWTVLIVLFSGQRKNWPAYFLYIGAIFVLAFGLTAFFWLPSLWEKQFTLVDQLLIKSLASYKIHFLCPQQLWFSPWGFGGSVPGCADGLSFALGKIYFLVIVLGLLVAVIKRSKVGLICFVLLAFSLFMTLPYSQFIWDRISQLWYLQFPWRFLEFAAVFSALLAGLILTLFKNRKITLLISAALIIAVIFLDGKYFRPQKLLSEASDQSQTSDYQVKWVISATSFEYLPKGIATKITDLGTLWVDIDKSQVQKTNLKVISGAFNIESQEFLPGKFSLSGNSRQGGTIQIQIVNFPGWRVWINTKEGTIDDSNPYKLITVNVPAGDFTVTGRFTDTPVRIIGNIISIIFIALTLGLLYGIRRDKR